jgi:hypothetical protein
MGKLIWKGLNKRADQISSQHFAITGANLRRNSKGKLERQNKTAKALARTQSEPKDQE